MGTWHSAGVNNREPTNMILNKSVQEHSSLGSGTFLRLWGYHCISSCGSAFLNKWHRRNEDGDETFAGSSGRESEEGIR